LLVAKKLGLKVSAPMFIPFMGAFITLKENPSNAWVESQVGHRRSNAGHFGIGNLLRDLSRDRQSIFFWPGARRISPQPVNLAPSAFSTVADRDRAVAVALDCGIHYHGS